MKILTVLLALGALGLTLMGCNKGEEASTAVPTDSSTATKATGTKKAAGASASDLSVPTGGANGPNFGSKGQGGG